MASMLLSPLLEDGKAEFHAEGMITRSAHGECWGRGLPGEEHVPDESSAGRVNGAPELSRGLAKQWSVPDTQYYTHERTHSVYCERASQSVARTPRDVTG